MLNAVELAELLKTLDNALVPLAKETDPSSKLSLIKIDSGSLTLEFPVSEPLLASLETLAETLKTGALRSLPEISRNAVAWLSTWTRKKNLKIDLSVGRSSYGSITPELDIKLDAAPRIRGSVTIPGVLRSVGGERPSLKIRTLTGELKTVACSEDLAKQAGKYLYRKIQIVGNAHTSILTGDAENITAVSIQLLDTKLSQGFKKMRKKFSGAFNPIEPDSFIEMVRGNN